MMKGLSVQQFRGLMLLGQDLEQLPRVIRHHPARNIGKSPLVLMSRQVFLDCPVGLIANDWSSEVVSQESHVLW